MNNFLSVVLILSGSLLCLGVLAAWMSSYRRKTLQRKLDSGEIAEFPKPKEIDSECCGAHEVCEKDSLLAGVSKKIEYYDDEELDRHKGKSSDQYNDNEVAEFREIFYTLRETEIAGWVRSLQLRDVSLPDSLKDEVILVLGERRFHSPE